MIKVGEAALQLALQARVLALRAHALRYALAVNLIAFRW